MRFMVIVKADKHSEAGEMPKEALLRDMGVYNDKLLAAGVMQSGEGLKPSSEGARVKFSGKERTVTHGPFPTPKNLIAGYWLFEASDLNTAIDWVKQAPNPMPGVSELEIRPVFEMDDFGAATTQELRAQEERQRAVIEARGNAAKIEAITPYLLFHGNCRQAITAYAEILGGTVTMMSTFGETPDGASIPKESAHLIMHARLDIGGKALMGSDMPPEMSQPVGGHSVSLSFSDGDEAERVFAALAKGGEVRMPIGKTFWAHRFGMLADRFSTPWMINCEKAE